MARAGLGSAFRQLQGLFAGRSVVGLEDGQLLARYASDRDETAFEALIERHGSMVLTICRAVLKNEHDSEDAFQATFLVLARRAGSIRGADSLGGWLHRVAYRASVQASVEAAKRRRKEAEAQAMAARQAPRAETDRELQALLHDEIDRLPESQRLPIVLCDLEGLTYEQAARQLRWTVPTLRNRLARGRQRLKTRLNRRGLATPALAGLSAVPPGLVKVTLSAATGGTASTTVALLARILWKGMLMTRLKIAGSATLAALALISAGIIAAGPAKIPDEPKPTAKPAPKAEVAASEARKPGEPVEVRGIVLTPDGKPFAGAKVWANVRNPFPEVTAGPDGRFLLRIPARDPARRYGDDSDSVVASASGFGLGWARVPVGPRPSDDLRIRLVADGPPIQGRVVDSKNQPVTDVIVKVRHVWVGNEMSFADWLAKAKTQEVQSPSEGLYPLSFPATLSNTIGTDGRLRVGPAGPPPRRVETSTDGRLQIKFEPLHNDLPAGWVATDTDGRFRLAGLGVDRVATLIISGPTIATTEIQVLTHDGPEIRTSPLPDRNVIRLAPPRTTVFLARKFEVVVGPTRPIEGVVRDQETGKPIAGMRIEAGVWDKRSSGADRLLGTETDAQGRYQLTGLGVSPSYWIFAAPTSGQPYLRTKMGIDEAPRTEEPVSSDIKLKRGVVVKGQVTDKATGRPVLGYVDPFLVADNPFLGQFVGIGDDRLGLVWTNPDGRFEVVMPPGRGLIAFLANREDYLTGVGAGGIKGYDPKQGRIVTRDRICQVGSFHVLAEVNLDPKAESATVDLQVDPGKSLELAVVDAEGRPIDGLRVEGTSPRYVNFVIPEKGPTVKIRGLDPSKPRRVTVFHDARRLVGSVWLKGDEVGPLTVRLGPWGTVVGRFVDAGGQGLGPWKIFSTANAQGPQAEDVGYLPGMMVGPGLMTDPEGRFRIEGLVPGLKYTAQVDAFESPEIKDLTLEPGEVKDLGEIKAWWRKPR